MPLGRHVELFPEHLYIPLHKKYVLNSENTVIGPKTKLLQRVQLEEVVYASKHGYKIRARLDNLRTSERSV